MQEPDIPFHAWVLGRGRAGPHHGQGRGGRGFLQSCLWNLLWLREPRAGVALGPKPVPLPDMTGTTCAASTVFVYMVLKSNKFMFKRKVYHFCNEDPGITCHQEEMTIKTHAVKSNNVIKSWLDPLARPWPASDASSPFSKKGG